MPTTCVVQKIPNGNCRNKILAASASDPNIVYFYNGHARGEAYYIDSGGNLIPPEYRFKKVIKDSDNSLLLRNRNGMTCQFYPLDGSNKAGKLAAIISRCSNRLTFSYNAYGQLSVVYDSLSRPIQNGNLRQATLTEIHSQGRIAVESFVTINIYDALNRLIRTSDNLGHTRRLYYDSRNLVIKTSDAQGPEQPNPLGRYTAGNINADGNDPNYQPQNGGATSAVRYTTTPRQVP